MRFFFLSCLAFVCSPVLCQRNPAAIITINTANVKTGKGKLYFEIERYRKDSGTRSLLTRIEIVKKVTTISIPAKDPIYCKMYLKSSDSSVYYDGWPSYLTNEPISVSFDDENMFVRSTQNDFYRKNFFVYLAMPARIRMDPQFAWSLLKRSYELVPNWRNRETVLLESSIKEYEDNVIETVKLNRAYYRTLDVLFDIRGDLTPKTLRTCFDIVKEVYKDAPLTKMLGDYVENSTKLSIGKPVPVFSVLDMNSNSIDAIDTYGKHQYTFLDFGASWCGPCRVQNRQIQKMYHTIDTAQVHIVSMSIDEKKENWFAAVKKDSIPWQTYIDKKGGWNGDIARNFNLSSIPANLMVNRTGEIVAIDMSFKELEAFLHDKGLMR